MTLMSPTVLGLVRVTRLLCGRDQRDVGRAHNVVMECPEYSSGLTPLWKMVAIVKVTSALKL